MPYFFLYVIFRILFKLLNVLLRFNRQSLCLFLIILMIGAGPLINYYSLYFNSSKKITNKSKIKSQKYAISKQRNKKKNHSVRLDEVRKTENVQLDLSKQIVENECVDLSNQMVENESTNMDQNEYYRLSHKNVQSVIYPAHPQKPSTNPNQKL